ncbi:MAG: type II 3-dehydroquinate dehydratase [Micrococcales bacterium]|jgi:3-dehydroquinate dehydratase-2|nr:type II 3-dehydroquinate dehydratase [Microbacteriaceae bacterium]NBR22611.1 type II 3-dehydroquinate dehydratase [Micrococcales bacterium]NBX94142.1 type II 3-dehydroquinate dehydratase [Actinomycetota bacterium]NBR77193.1 type II 3-dehydroquinate dehydratase [Microbacteriaceae bacterium]NBS60499.1 type II 3-dehydroquinate dehydratase [Microbacteriaceae bacterium]
MTQVLILNGPNLNRLGSREPDVYGSQSYEELVAIAEAEASKLGLTVDVKQSNDEAELINWIHGAVDAKTHVIINPAAFTHYSYALRDACALVTTAGLKLIEVHISNPHARETFRHTSVISGVATGVIAGFGLDSYRLALVQLSH